MNKIDELWENFRTLQQVTGTPMISKSIVIDEREWKDFLTEHKELVIAEYEQSQWAKPITELRELIKHLFDTSSTQDSVVFALDRIDIILSELPKWDKK